MFDVGSSVVVLNTFGSKGLLRRGSVGYFSMSTDPVEVQVPKTQIRLIVSAMTIFFTRFGFDKKARCEKKVVINMLPVSMLDTKEAYEILNNVIEGKNKIINPILEDIKKHFKCKTVVILAPFTDHRRVNLLESKANALAYYMSAISSAPFLREFREIPLDFLANNLNVERNIVVGITHARPESKKARKDLLEFFSTREDFRQESLLLLRKILFMFNLNKIPEAIKEFKVRSQKGRPLFDKSFVVRLFTEKYNTNQFVKNANMARIVFLTGILESRKILLKKSKTL